METPSVSTRERKLIASLCMKKYRDREGLFVAEGEKVIAQLCAHYEPRLIVGEKLWTKTPIRPDLMRIATASQLRAMSNLQSPTDFVALFQLPPSPETLPKSEAVVVALDSVQNPGNLGTIIRLCDWLGIEQLVLGKGTVDPFSPKVVQATAGALGAVRLYTDVDLTEYLSGLDEEVRVFATALEGNNISQVVVPERCVVLFGNEGHGLSASLLSACDELINIPAAPSTVSESLNVSISAAIILSKIAKVL